MKTQIKDNGGDSRWNSRPNNNIQAPPREKTTFSRCLWLDRFIRRTLEIKDEFGELSRARRRFE